MKNRYDNYVIDHINVVYTENKTKLSNWLDRVWYVTKTRQDNNVIDQISLVYVEFETKWSTPIRSGVVCDENQIRQWRGWS